MNWLSARAGDLARHLEYASGRYQPEIVFGDVTEELENSAAAHAAHLIIFGRPGLFTATLVRRPDASPTHAGSCLRDRFGSGRRMTG